MGEGHAALIASITVVEAGDSTALWVLTPKLHVRARLLAMASQQRVPVVPSARDERIRLGVARCVTAAEDGARSCIISCVAPRWIK